jgi:hypothetical protein
MDKVLIFEQAFKKVYADLVEETKHNISMREFLT